MERLKKAYVWFSGILVAFLATYITAVLTAIIPAPKDLLCKVSLGFCPPPIVITFGATDIDRIVDRRDVGQAVGNSQIGMLHNNVETNERRPNMVKYRFRAEAAGEYNVRILYASNEARPVQIEVNEDSISQDALAITTGGWENENRRWSTSYPVRLKLGDNSLVIRRNDVFPHLSKIELMQVRK